MKVKKAAGVCALLLILNCSFSIAGVETIIPLSSVPQNLLSEAEKLLPTATFNTANTEKEADGTLVYEIQGTLEDGRKVEVDVLENGDIQEFEVVYSLDLVPRAVMKAIEKRCLVLLRALLKRAIRLVRRL